ncbi:MAG TPA: transketolase C-terminal domain-containing protein [Mycobacteriales bacterium]|nr:transketolase C-terminal domain-containing protein [Mycobacteriales bacterium]
MTAAPAAGAPAGAAEGEAVSDRDAYRATLIRLARLDSRIWCLDSDTGGLEPTFGAALPEQYADLGIAEANLMTVGAALARTGLLPFVNTMAAFASTRALEQVRVDIAYHNLPVRIVGTHSGFSAAHLGPTHHGQHDLAAMRTLPNMTVLAPADPAETARMIEAVAYLPGPAYIRLGHHPIGPVYRGERELVVGRAVRLRPGGDVTIVAAGSYPLLFALAAAEELAAAGVEAAVLNMHTIKPLDVAALVAAAEHTRGIVTVEDHSVLGGLGGAVAEALAEHQPARVCRVGIRDAFCALPGSHRAQLAAAGVSTERVVAAARAVLGVPPTTRAGRRAGVPVTGLPAGNHHRRRIP